MFTQDNTEGYTDEQLAALNEELHERTRHLALDSDEYQQAEKAFSDEVARR